MKIAFFRIGLRSFLAIGLVLGCNYLGAEVGTVHEPSSPTSATGMPYIAGIITDDSDPFPPPAVWLAHNSSSRSRRILNPNGYIDGDGYPTIVVHPQTRVPVVAWSQNSVNGFDIVISTFVQGNWTQPTVVVDEATDTLNPQLTVDPATGVVHLVYWVDGDVPRVMHRQAPADLSSWSNPVQVSDAADVACRPDAVVHEGVLRVAYEVHDRGFEQTPLQVVLARYDSGGFIAEVVAITHHAGQVRPEVHSQSGHIWVDWIDSDNEIAWARMEAAGWTATRYEPYATIEERDYLVRGAIRMKAIR